MKPAHRYRAIPLLMLALLFLTPAASSAVEVFFLKNLPVDWMTREDAQIMWRSVQQVLNENEQGETTTWENPHTGAGGELTPIGDYTKEDLPCRKLKIFNRAGKDEANWVFGFCNKADRGWLVDH